MYKLITCLFFLVSVNANSVFDIFSGENLRTGKLLIIEISNVVISPCPDCAVQFDRFSYNVEVMDAYIGLSTEDTSRGVVYKPYTRSFKKTVRGSYLWTHPVNIPKEGLYFGYVYNYCHPRDIMANGDCRVNQIGFSLESEEINPKK